MKNMLLNAGFQPLCEFKQSVSNYYIYDQEKCIGLVRARNSGDKNCITYKYFRDAHNDEVEIETGSTLPILESFIEKICPDSRKSKVEKYRQVWTSSNKLINEIVIDKWPGLPEILEIDCKTEKALIEVVEKLSLTANKTFSKGAFEIYEDLFGIRHDTLYSISLRFSNIKETLFPYLVKNHKLFLEHCKIK